MVQPRLHAIGLALALGLAFVPAVGNGEVVFGNLGPTGTATLSSQNTDITTVEKYAAAFTTGTAGLSPLRLTSITLGLFHSETQSLPFTLSIYNDDNGEPGLIAFTSQPVTIGDVALYEFMFKSQALSANTTYWILPNTGLSWYRTSFSPRTPVAYNNSGYTFSGYRSIEPPSTTWNPDIFEVSFSISAVPEQGTLPLAGIGLVGAGWAMRRMKRRSAAETVASEAVNDAGV
jgi:hypothetical protein